jgi:VWFA-related protein
VTRGIVATLVTAAALVHARADQRPIFRARTDLVTVQVSVTEGNRPVQGLTLKDFELTDNGVRQQLELLDTDTLPIDLTVVLDQSGSMARSFDEVKRDVQEIAGMLRPADRIRVITFAGDIRETVAFQPPDGDLSLHTLAAAGSTSLFDAVAAAIVRATDSERRHLIVVLTDGVDTSSLLDRGALDDLSRHSEAVLYAAVAVPPVPEPPPPAPRTQTEPLMFRRSWTPPLTGARDAGPLRVAVDNTGGVWEWLWSIGRAPRGVGRALEWFRTVYVVRYRATGVAPRGWHEVQVKLTRPGDYDVRARMGYFAQ